MIKSKYRVTIISTVIPSNANPIVEIQVVSKDNHWVCASDKMDNGLTQTQVQSLGNMFQNIIDKVTTQKD